MENKKVFTEKDRLDLIRFIKKGNELKKIVAEEAEYEFKAKYYRDQLGKLNHAITIRELQAIHLDVLQIVHETPKEQLEEAITNYFTIIQSESERGESREEPPAKPEAEAKPEEIPDKEPERQLGEDELVKEELEPEPNDSPNQDQAMPSEAVPGLPDFIPEEI